MSRLPFLNSIRTSLRTSLRSPPLGPWNGTALRPRASTRAWTAASSVSAQGTPSSSA